MSFRIKNGILTDYIPEPGQTEIVIPDGVTKIEPGVFWNCSHLRKITLPEGFTEIIHHLFYSCVNLTEIIIPESVSIIGENAFQRTEWYKNHPDDLVIVNHIIIGYKGKAETLTIPGGVVKIAPHAFSKCYSLREVVLPESLIEIGEWAFEECRNLTSVTFPESLKIIDSAAFAHCPLKSVRLPERLEIMGGHAFGRDAKIRHFHISQYLKKFGTHAMGCAELEDITVSEHNPNYAAFDGVLYDKQMRILLFVPKLKTSVTIPDGVARIEEWAFSDTNLKSIHIPESVKSIGRCAFYHCSELKEICLPSGLNYIPDSVFCRCRNLTEAIISDNVEYIGYAVFDNCENLTFVHLPASICEIGFYLFRDCDNLREIELYGVRFSYELFKMLLENENTLLQNSFNLKECISKHFPEIFHEIVRKNMTFLLKQMLLSSYEFINRKNIDDCIQYAIDKKSYEIQVMLIHCKMERNWYDDEETMRKKFEL